MLSAKNLSSLFIFGMKSHQEKATNPLIYIPRVNSSAENCLPQNTPASEPEWCAHKEYKLTKPRLSRLFSPNISAA